MKIDLPTLARAAVNAAKNNPALVIAGLSIVAPKVASKAGPFLVALANRKEQQ